MSELPSTKKRLIDEELPDKRPSPKPSAVVTGRFFQEVIGASSSSTSTEAAKTTPQPGLCLAIPAAKNLRLCLVAEETIKRAKDYKDRYQHKGDNNHIGQMLAGITGGSAFTNKRNRDGLLNIEGMTVDGERHPGLTPEAISELRQNTHAFFEFAEEMLKFSSSRKELDEQAPVGVFRSMTVSDPQTVKIGSILRDILPSSSTCELEFAKKWAVGGNKVLLEILVRPNYPVICNCYPDGQGTRKPPINQGQAEIMTPPATYSVVEIYVRDGVTITQVEPKVIEWPELEEIFKDATARASDKKRLEAEKLQEKKKQVKDDNPTIEVTRDDYEVKLAMFKKEVRASIMEAEEGEEFLDINNKRWKVTEAIGRYVKLTQID